MKKEKKKVTQNKNLKYVINNGVIRTKLDYIHALPFEEFCKINGDMFTERMKEIFGDNINLLDVRTAWEIILVRNAMLNPNIFQKSLFNIRLMLDGMPRTAEKEERSETIIPVALDPLDTLKELPEHLLTRELERRKESKTPLLENPKENEDFTEI